MRRITHSHVTVYMLALLLAEALGSKHLDILRKRKWRSFSHLRGWRGAYKKSNKKHTDGLSIGLCVSYDTFMGLFFSCKTFFFVIKCLVCFSPFRKGLS